MMGHTNQCYRLALLEEYPEFFKRFIDLESMSHNDMKAELGMAGFQYNSETINKHYLDHLCKLPTAELQLIIDADKKQKVNRSPVTIHAIVDELFHRAANGRKS